MLRTESHTRILWNLQGFLQIWATYWTPLKRPASHNHLTPTSISALPWKSWGLAPPFLSSIPNKIHILKEALIKMPRLSLLAGTVRHHMRETGAIGGIRSKYHHPHVLLLWNGSTGAAAQVFGQCLLCRMGEENTCLLHFQLFKWVITS